MFSSFLNALLTLSKKSSPQKLFDYDCVTLYKFRGLMLTFLKQYCFNPITGSPSIFFNIAQNH